MIRLEGVGKRYRDGTVAVEDLSLEAGSGQITALVGPSGSGKTTTLRMINRLIEPTSGRIVVDGRDTSSLDAAVLRRGMGYVIQQGGLFPHRTVVDNVATVPLLVGVGRRQARRRALDLLELVGLSADVGGRYPAQLSGGQQQRVGVARALAADPPILLMDEPFSAVDPVVRAELQDELVRIQADLAKTIVLVTHDIDEAIKLGDKVAVLRVGGKLAQFGSPADVLDDPVDTFVATFVGRDRGYRALGFTRTEELPIATERTVRLGEPMPVARMQAAEGWVLVVVDGDNRPKGWLATDEAGEVDEGSVRPELLKLGGTLARLPGSSREALDAALSSPSGRGVVIDDDGRTIGTILAVDVVSRLPENDRRLLAAGSRNEPVAVRGEER